MAKNEYGFDPNEWKGINKEIRNWITLNKELWNDLTAYEKEALKTSKDMAKNAKEASETAKEVRNVSVELAKVAKHQLGNTEQSLNMQGNLLSMGVKALKLDQKGDVLSKKRAKAISGIVDITQDYLANMSAIGTEEFQSLDFTKKIREARKLGLDTEVAYLESVKAQYDVQSRLNDQIKAQTELIKKPFGAVDDFIKGIPVVGEMLAAKLDITGIGDKISEGFVTKVQESFAMAQEEALGWNQFQSTLKGSGLDPSERASAFADYKMQQDGANKSMKMGLGTALAITGAITAWAVSAFKFAAEMGVGFSQISVGMLLFKDETRALLDEFGRIDDVSTGMLWTMKKASWFSGVQATDMAKIAMLQTSITDMSKEQSLDKQAKFIKEIKKEGLSASKVMGDLATNADMFANFAKDGGKNMEDAAKQAAKMGLDLSATSAVAEKLLDWESSIAAEQEASMLLGKSINLDKARQLAYSGDLAAMMTEVKNQAGGEAEFAKMSVVQREALGEAIGLTGAQLSTFMKAEEGAAQASGKAWYKSFWAIAALLTVVGGLVGFILGGLAPWKLITAGAGAAWGAGIGAALGLVGAGMITAAGDVFSPAKGKTQISPKEGGIYNLSPNDDFMAAPGLINNMGGGSNVIVDNSKVESQNDKIIELLASRNEQAEMQSRKGIRATEGAFAQR